MTGIIESSYRKAYWNIVNPVTEWITFRYECRFDTWKRKSIELADPYTMVGWRRLANTYDLCQLVESEGIPGAFVECGVFNGGCAALMAGVSMKNNTERITWLLDSFEGLPQPTERDGKKAARYANGAAHEGRLESIGKCVGSLDLVEKVLYEVFELERDRQRIVKGWFQDTIDKVNKEIGKIAILRLDGDWYESTMKCLEGLYDNVSKGGYVILDDYGYWEGCRLATDEFRSNRAISSPLHQVDDSAVYFQKTG